MRLGSTAAALVLTGALLGWSAIASAEPLAPPPEGYLQVDRGLCAFVLPERNVGVTGELVPICDEELPRIFSQLGVAVPEKEQGAIEVRVVADPAEMGKLAPEGKAPPSWSGAVA
ncbi:MAG: hypothetical protein JRF63_01465, partial [Deltaproteobacteria bacterium]|nr:hypothetical protein [Deltaproteobacteria bacterium]